MSPISDIDKVEWANQFNVATCQKLLATAKQHKLHHRGILINNDDLSQRIYLLLSGRVKMLRQVVCGEEALQQQLQPGDMFCPVAMLRNYCCSYAESITPCVLLSWSHHQFQEVMRNDQQLHEHLFKAVVEQMETERHERCLLQCTNVRTRVAATLLQQLIDPTAPTKVTPHTVDMRPMTLAAQELGMARETLSRILTAFEREGVLINKRGLLTIQNYNLLQLIVDGNY